MNAERYLHSLNRARDQAAKLARLQNILLEEAGRLHEKMQGRKGLDLNDFLGQMRQIKKMGSLGKLLGMIPGMGAMAGEMREKLDQDSGEQLKKVEAIILSMTPRERRHPDLLNGSRRKRVALGSGHHPSDVNELLRNFREAQRMTKKMQKMQKRLPKGAIFG